MNTPLITWCCIAAIALIIVMTRIYSAVAQHRHIAVRVPRHTHHRRRVLEMGRECEEFFIPGDMTYRSDSDDYDFND